MKNTYLIKYVFLLLFVFSASAVFAQKSVITGKVVDEANQPLPGAAVTVKGTLQGTQTDANGSFRLTGVSGAVTLHVTFVGYQAIDKVVDASGNVTVNFNLVPNSKSLSEVVVIGYGSVQKKDLTGAIATVSAKDFQQGQNTSPMELIAGKIAGVSITSNSGAPGSGSTVRIRQGSSLNATNDPLYIIDGVPIQNASISGVADPLSMINPNDIETFTVLKDAASTAIYGSRASNGVIIITTKKGSKGAPKITFSTKLSASDKIKDVDVFSAAQVRSYIAANNPSKVSLLGNANTNWQNEIFHTGIASDNNLSVSGTAANLPYRVSIGYLDQTGILKTDQLKRTTASISLSPKYFHNTLSVNLNLNGSMSDSRFANTGAIGAAIAFDPTQPVYQAGSPWGGYYEWYNDPTKPGGNGNALDPNAPRNPLGLLYNNHNTSKAYRSYGNLQLDYSFPFVPGLHANYNFGYDVAKGSGQTYIPTNAAQVSNGLGSYSPYANNYQNIVSEFYLSYNKDIKSIKSNINVIAGTGYYNNLMTNYNFRSLAANRDTIEGTSPPPTKYDKPENTLLSYYTRLIYTFDDKYILQGSVRRDGSSRFAPAERYSVFPGAAFTWKISQEDFLKDSHTLSLLNLRASYGVTGQQEFGTTHDYDYLPSYFLGSGTGQYEFDNTFYSVYTPNAYTSDLKWEQTESTNLGFDYGFLNNRITGSVDVYYKNTKDLLSLVKVATGANFSTTVFTNVGRMVNRGLEFNIAASPIKTQDVNWNVGFNVAYQESKITKLDLANDPGFIQPVGGIAGSLGGYAQVYAVGRIPNTFYLEKQVYGANGKPLEGVYESTNGVSADMDFEHSPLPKFIYGFSTDFSYKKWTISTVLRANVGNYVYNNVAASDGTAQNIAPTFALVNNSSTSLLATNFQVHQYFSDYYLQNASFVKMDNLDLSYNAGHIFHDKKINLGITASCQNVFTITQYKGIDPEINGGIDNNFYPRPRTFTLGVNLGL